MKKICLYATLFCLLVTACAKMDTALQGPQNPAPEGQAAVQDGTILIKFVPEMTDILDRALMTEGIRTRSGIPSTDEVLDILGAYSFERVFPYDVENEARTRAAGLHLWYLVSFDEDTDIQEAVTRISRLGEVSKYQTNTRIMRAYNPHMQAKVIDETLLQLKGRASGGTPTAQPMYKYQWHYHNTGSYPFSNKGWNDVVAGADAGCEEAWKKCTGDPSIIVAVLDEGVMYTHPDLAANMWVNEGEEMYGPDGNQSEVDVDGNGYCGDKHGYNFVKKSGVIAYSGFDYTGHGTHVAGTIAADNTNDIGIAGIAGGSSDHPGVKIMSCQLFDGNLQSTVADEAKAIKYAADNGAVILQCSWGYMSADSDALMGPEQGPKTVKEWESRYPLEKEAIDYFIDHAGSPNGVIEGGIAVFASGNEYACSPSFPSAYSRCVSVSAIGADYKPASYTNYGEGVDLCAPGGDLEYYCNPGVAEDIYVVPDRDNYQGGVLSTIVLNGLPKYAWFEGTSMACPHVAGIAALGLSYAVQQRRHFTAEEFIRLMKDSALEIDDKFVGKKKYYSNHTSPGAYANIMELSRYRGKMGRMAHAGRLLDAIDDRTSGTDMVLPNLYMQPESVTEIDLSSYFASGQTFKASVGDSAVAAVEVVGNRLKVSSLKAGITTVTVTPSAEESRTVVLTVRKDASDQGWM